MEQIPCGPEKNSDECAVYRKTGRCFEDMHHLYWPRADYRTKTEKEFRELEENKVRMCRCLHNMEHALWEIPDKPDVEIMKLAIMEERNGRLQPPDPPRA